MIGVYQIRNTQTNKYYVGSSKNIESRLRTHLKLLRKGEHPNGRLQKAFALAGESSFTFDTLIECSMEQLWEMEQLFINKLDCEYNIMKIAGKYHEWREEVKRARSKLMLGNQYALGNCFKQSEEARVKASKTWIGKHHSEEAKKKIGLASKLKTWSEKTKLKMSLSLKNSSKAIAHRVELHKGMVGNQHAKGKHWKLSEETKEMMREAQRKRFSDKPVSEETKQKMRHTHKRAIK